MAQIPPHPANPPQRVTREGRFARVVPLNATAHGAELWSGGLSDPAVWTYLAYGPFETEAAFLDWLATRDRLADPLYFAIIDRSSGKALGCATLMEIRPANGVIEVGHIFFSPALQKTPIATEAIFLLMRYVFEDLGYRRFEWKCDNGNEPSKRAAQRFGFVPEGLFRQHMIVKSRNRDTAWFSIIDSEWPVLKGAYESWLAPENFDEKGQQQTQLRLAIETAGARKS
jgi:RimJ/RimL family protein N-acetyltransferase